MQNHISKSGGDPSPQSLDHLLKSLTLASFEDGKINDGITYLKAALVINSNIFYRSDNITIKCLQEENISAINSTIGFEVFILYQTEEQWLRKIEEFFRENQAQAGLNSLQKAFSQYPHLTNSDGFQILHNEFLQKISMNSYLENESLLFISVRLGYVDVVNYLFTITSQHDLFDENFGMALRISAESKNRAMIQCIFHFYLKYLPDIYSKNKMLSKDKNEVAFLTEYINLDHGKFELESGSDKSLDDSTKLNIFTQNWQDESKSFLENFLNTLSPTEKSKIFTIISLLLEYDNLKNNNQRYLNIISKLHHEIRAHLLWDTISSPMNSNITDGLITQFQESVCRGDLSQVNIFLKSDPTLVYALGTIRDLSKRVFIKITGFQYAFWARDRRMCYLLLKYLPKEAANLQKSLFEHQRPDITRIHGVRYSFNDIIETLKYFIKHVSQMNYDQAKQFWCCKYGKAQSTLPAWIVYLWMEVGKSIGWINGNYSHFIRKPDELEAWWNQGNLRLGHPSPEESFAWWRWVLECALMAPIFAGDIDFLENVDYRALQQLSLASDAEMDELSRLLASEEPLSFLQQDFNNEDLPGRNDQGHSDTILSKVDPESQMKHTEKPMIHYGELKIHEKHIDEKDVRGRIEMIEDHLQELALRSEEFEKGMHLIRVEQQKIIAEKNKMMNLVKRLEDVLIAIENFEATDESGTRYKFQIDAKSVNLPERISKQMDEVLNHYTKKREALDNARSLLSVNTRQTDEQMKKAQLMYDNYLEMVAILKKQVEIHQIQLQNLYQTSSKMRP